MAGAGQGDLNKTSPDSPVHQNGVALHILTVLGLTAVGALWISIAKDWGVPVHDDPIYAQAAFDFASTGSIVLPDLSGPTAVFEAVWGGLFVKVLGPTYGALRVASLVLVLASVPAMFWMLRLLGTSPSLSVVGAAAYVFNPMFFSISNSYMTDGHTVDLLVVASALFVRGMVREGNARLFLALGGLASGVAFLSRQQALVLPIAASLVLLLSKDHAKWPKVLIVGGSSGLIVLVYLVWAQTAPEPAIRSLIVEEVGNRTPGELAQIAGSSVMLGVAYFGLFLVVLLPLMIQTFVIKGRRRLGPLVVASAVGLAIVLADVIRRSDFVLTHDTWWAITGLGAIDRGFLGERPALVPLAAVVLLTVGAFLAAWLAIAVSGSQREFGVVRAFFGLSILGFAATTYVGALAFHLVALDRYWLPLLPLAIALSIPYVRSSTWSFLTTCACILATAFISVAGTRDALVASHSSLALAADFTPEIVPVNRFDGGAPWMALTFGVPDIDSETFPVPGPFWVAFFNPELEPEYGISLEPLDGYEIVAKREYSSWLLVQPTYLYVLHRDPSLGFYVRSGDF